MLVEFLARGVVRVLVEFLARRHGCSSVLNILDIPCICSSEIIIRIIIMTHDHRHGQKKKSEVIIFKYRLVTFVIIIVQPGGIPPEQNPKWVLNFI